MMRRSTAPLIIEGPFGLRKRNYLLQMSAKLFAVFFFLVVLGTLLVYGFRVHFEDSINRVARDSRSLNEQNKELQVQLNHIRSFKNVEVAAMGVPHLHRPSTVIEINAISQIQFPAMPKTVQEFPRAYGY